MSAGVFHGQSALQRRQHAHRAGALLLPRRQAACSNTQQTLAGSLALRSRAIRTNAPKLSRCGTSSTSRPCLSRSIQKLAASGPLLTQPAANVRFSLCQRLLCTDVEFLWSQFIDTVATPKGTNETLSPTPASGSPTSSPTGQTLPPAQGSSTGAAPSRMSPRPRKTYLKCICRHERDRCTACPMVHRTIDSSKRAIMRADTLPPPAWVSGKARMKLLIIFRFMDACCNELVPGGALVPHGT